MRERIKNKQITKKKSEGSFRLLHRLCSGKEAVPIALIMQEVMKNFQDA